MSFHCIALSIKGRQYTQVLHNLHFYCINKECSLQRGECRYLRVMFSHSAAEGCLKTRSRARKFKISKLLFYEDKQSFLYFVIHPKDMVHLLLLFMSKATNWLRKAFRKTSRQRHKVWLFQLLATP